MARKKITTPEIEALEKEIEAMEKANRKRFKAYYAERLKIRTLLDNHYNNMPLELHQASLETDLKKLELERLTYLEELKQVKARIEETAK